MKKLSILLFFVALIATSASAQIYSTKGKDTSTNVDTTYITYTSINSGVKGLQAAVTKVSGTPAGTILYQGTIDGANWVDATTDTFKLTNVALQTHVWAVSRTTYISYRAKIITSGTQVSVIQFSYCRRPDEGY